MKQNVERSLKSAIEALQAIIKASDEEEIKLGYIRNELYIALDYLNDEDEICFCPVAYERPTVDHHENR